MDQEELEEWIEEQIRQGYSPEEIEEVLMDEGVDPSRAREAEKNVRNRLNRDTGQGNSRSVDGPGKQDSPANQNVPQKDDTGRRPQGSPDPSRDSNQASDNLETAGLGSRILAYIVDLFIQSFGLGIIFVALIFSGVLGPESTNPFMMIYLLFLGLYFILFEGKYGKTPGKMATNIRVVQGDGSDIGYVKSLVRNVLRIVDQFGLYLLGMVIILLTEDSQRVGDLVANTIVVKEG